MDQRRAQTRQSDTLGKQSDQDSDGISDGRSPLESKPGKLVDNEAIQG